MPVAFFTNVFSLPEGDLFVLFSISLAVQKVLNLIGSHFFFLIFVFITVGVDQKQSFCSLCLRVFCLYFPLEFYSVHPYTWVFKWEGNPKKWGYMHQFSSVHFSRSVVSNSLQPHESQHARPPCPSPISRVHSDSHPSSQ